MEDSKARLETLNRVVTETWARILDNSKFVRIIRDGKLDKRLYALYLCQTYEYTRHNARNQALVGVLAQDIAPQYQKFCFDHAMEETGHELMALHDAHSLGVAKDAKMPGPLPATEVLVAYLYYISAQGNPVQRLGYSFWAENSYHHVNPLIERIKDTLQLKNSQMTFFVAHSAIDKDHAEEVERMILQHCKTEKDWADVQRCAVLSLELTGNILEDVYWEYQKLVDGKPSPYAFLNSL